MMEVFKMRDITKYQGIIPAFYACYDESGAVSPERVEALTEHLIKKGVKGVYVGGSSGECIYQSVAERKLLLEHVMKVGKGKLTVIAHVACNNTADSMELAAHAESLGVDAIAAIPPIYFHLPPHAIAEYWNDISKAAPNTDFVIYNIPQLAGVALTMPLFKEMLKNNRVAAVKNSSMPVQDIQLFKSEGGEDFAVFNGPDEQLISGRRNRRNLRRDAGTLLKNLCACEGRKARGGAESAVCCRCHHLCDVRVSRQSLRGHERDLKNP